MNYIKPTERHQLIMFNSIDEMISKDNSVRLIDLFIDKFVKEQPEEFNSCKESNYGAPSYSPSLMLKLYFYGYLNQIKSSRKLENESYRNLEIIWLIGNLHPDHWTISNFRRSQGEKIKKVWNLFKLFLKSNDYIDLKLVAIDGTKVKAYTKRDMLSMETIKKTIEYTEERMEEYLQSLEINDSDEDYSDESERTKALNAGELQSKISTLESKLQKYKEYKEYLEAKGKERLSINEPEVNLVKSREGKLPGYNVQAVTDLKNHMIAEIDETTEENDMHQLKPMIKKINETYNENPLIVSADNGYYNLDAIEELSSLGIDVNVSAKKEQDSDGIEFTYDKERDVYICSEGKELRIFTRNKRKRNSLADVYRCKECKNCPKFGKCTTSENGRVHSRYKNQEFRDSYEEKMRSKTGKKMMQVRKSLAEHPFGTIKYLMGKIPLIVRGKEKVSVEIKLYAMAYNFKRLINISSFEDIVEQIESFSCK